MTDALDMPYIDSGSGDNNFGYRRSKRKKSSYQRLTSSESAVRNISKFKTGSSTACLSSLPTLVLSRLLQFLDVESLENLSATCSMFDQLIAGQYLTSLSIPFSPEFVSEMKTAKSIDRKPLLKLEIGKSKGICLQTMLRGGYTTGYYYPRIIEYLMESQLSILDLRQVRELNLVLNTSSKITWQDMLNITDFYLNVLIYPTKRFRFEHITRLHMMMGEDCIAVHDLVWAMTNLIELGLHIHVRKNLNYLSIRNDYIYGLQNVVAASRAPILKLIFLSETRKSVEKILTSSVVERLEIEGACTVNIVPVMRNLKEVVVRPKPKSSNSPGELCTYWKSKKEDRAIHRAGLCCVNLGATYANCPNLTRFMGIDVPSGILS